MRAGISPSLEWFSLCAGSWMRAVEAGDRRTDGAGLKVGHESFAPGISIFKLIMVKAASQR